MSPEEIKELSKAIKKQTEKLANNPKAAKAFLVKAGILTEKGYFKARYKHLCILLDQA